MPESTTNDTFVMLQSERLSKRFGDILAVDDLTFDLSAGEVFGLLGPNGAGKTTSIRMLCALISVTAGRAQVAGYEVGRQDTEIRRRVGILTESPGLYDQLSAERNLSFFATLYEVPDIPAQVERYLRMLGLWGRRSEAVGTFSKGMRQKLAIARALLHEPRVLFLDEPTSGLDPEAARLVRDFIDELKREGRTIVICTHNLDEADRLCDRIGVLKTRLLALDSPKSLRRKLFDRNVVFHLAQPGSQFIKQIEALDYVKSVRAMENKIVVTLDQPEERNPDIVRELVNSNADIRFIGEIRQSLEDVYLRLVSETDVPN